VRRRPARGAGTLERGGGPLKGHRALERGGSFAMRCPALEETSIGPWALFIFGLRAVWGVMVTR
jgi:hypothetical protein